MTDPLKIMTVSLVDDRKFKAFAMYKGESLVIADIRPISGMFSKWKAPLIAEVKERVADGYAVIIEEAGESISQYGTQYLLDEMDEVEGKTRLQLALDGYFEMEGIGALIIAKEHAQYGIKIGAEGGWIEKKSDEKGRPFYALDWKKLTGAHRAVLLCVIAAMREPLSERYLNAMWGKAEEHYEENPVRRWRDIFDARDIERGRELDRMREEK